MLAAMNRRLVWSPDGHTAHVEAPMDDRAAWGSIRSSFFQTFGTRLLKMFDPNGTSLQSGLPANTSDTPINYDQQEPFGGTNPAWKECGYIQYGAGNISAGNTVTNYPATSSNYAWPTMGTINKYWKKGTATTEDDALFWFQGDQAPAEQVNSIYNNELLNQHLPEGYSIWRNNAANSDANINLDINVADSVTSKRIYQFLMGTYPDAPATAKVDAASAVFRYMDGYHTELQTWPATAVPMITSVDAKHILMAIDPTNKFMFLGESEIFPNDTNDSPILRMFENVIQFILHTADYGGSFSDMLMDSSSQPELWDTTMWGRNAYPN
jgi:hypothetical protein